MTHWRLILTVAALAVFSAVITSQTPSGHALFEQALAKERVEGNLPEAIRLYERVVSEFASDRPLAAQALVQVGLCYEKLGRDEAIRAYERLVRDFADQEEAVTQARVRLAALKRSAPSTITPAAMAVQPLPDVGKDGEMLAVSPDGTKAIVMDYSKGQNIALYDFARKQTRLLTDLDWSMGWTYWAAWSRDGRRVAYVQASVKSDVFELRVTSLDGQSSVVHRSEGPQPVQPLGWTPDGATLVVVVGRPDKTWAVGTLPATGGPFAPLRSLGWSFDYRVATPRLSPDGRWLAYLEGEAGQRDVHVVGLDGRNAYRITDHPGDDFAPVWSADNRHLVFTSNRLGAVSLWMIEVKDGKSIGQALKLKDGMQSARLIDWTARGVFYDQRTNTWDLYTMPMDPIEGRATGAPRQIAYSRTGRNVSPVWSPDGGQLAFVSSAAIEPGRRYVVVMPADGGPVREFLVPTTSWAYPESPPDLRWFGDGRGLGFSGTDTRGAAAVFRLRLDTGDWDAIPLFDAWQTRTEWNRDGSAFYFSRQGGTNAGIFERAANGDAERLVYRAGADSMIRGLEFSPDRKWLAFLLRTPDDHGRTTRHLIVDVETGETRVLFEEVRDLNDPSAPQLVGWTPSGDLLVERRREGAASETLIVPVNRGAPRSIAIPTFPSSGPRERQLGLIGKWSPTGRSMVLVRENRSTETFVIENLLALAGAPESGSRK